MSSKVGCGESQLSGSSDKLQIVTQSSRDEEKDITTDKVEEKTLPDTSATVVPPPEAADVHTPSTTSKGEAKQPGASQTASVEKEVEKEQPQHGVQEEQNDAVVETSQKEDQDRRAGSATQGSDHLRIASEGERSQQGGEEEGCTSQKGPPPAPPVELPPQGRSVEVLQGQTQEQHETDVDPEDAPKVLSQNHMEVEETRQGDSEPLHISDEKSQQGECEGEGEGTVGASQASPPPLPNTEQPNPPDVSPDSNLVATNGVKGFVYREEDEVEGALRHLHTYARLMRDMQRGQGIAVPDEDSAAWECWMGLVATTWASKHPTLFILIRETVTTYWEATKRAGGYPGISVNMDVVESRLKDILAGELLRGICPALSLEDAMVEVAEFGDVNRAIDFHTNVRKGKRIKRSSMHPSARTIEAAVGVVVERPKGSKFEELLAVVPSLTAREAQTILMRCNGDMEKAVQELMLDPPALRTPEPTVNKPRRAVMKLAHPNKAKSELQLHLEAMPIETLRTSLDAVKASQHLDATHKRNVSLRRTVEEILEQLARLLNRTTDDLKNNVFFAA